MEMSKFTQKNFEILSFTPKQATIVWSLFEQIPGKNLMKSPTTLMTFTLALSLSATTTACIHRIGKSKVTSKKGLYTAYTLNIPRDGGMLRVVLNPTRTRYLIEFAKLSPKQGTDGVIAYEYHMGSISTDHGQMTLQPEDLSSCSASKRLITTATSLVQGESTYTSNDETNEADAVQLSGKPFERYTSSAESNLTFVLMPGYEKADMKDLAIRDGHIACFYDGKMDLARKKSPTIDNF